MSIFGHLEMESGNSSYLGAKRMHCRFLWSLLAECLQLDPLLEVCLGPESHLSASIAEVERMEQALLACWDLQFQHHFRWAGLLLPNYDYCSRRSSCAPAGSDAKAETADLSSGRSRLTTVTIAATRLEDGSA